MSRKNDVTGAELVSKANTKAYAEGYDRIFGSKIAMARLNDQVAHITTHGPDVPFTPEPERLTFDELVSRLETVIFVTNKVDTSLMPKGPITIPYYVECVDSQITRWHEIVVKHWARCYLDPTLGVEMPIAGMSRGLINLAHYDLRTEEYYTIQLWPTCEADRDQIYKAGFNIVRNFVGQGYVLWESLIWVNGKVTMPMVWPITRDDADDRATLQALISRGILPARS